MRRSGRCWAYSPGAAMSAYAGWAVVGFALYGLVVIFEILIALLDDELYRGREQRTKRYHWVSAK